MNSNTQTKEGFLQQLRLQLKSLSYEERENAVRYYEEYLEDAGEENIEETLANLGSPREIAVTILKERAFEDLKTSPPSAKKGISAAWMVVLAIIASPIALPIALAAAAVVLFIGLTIVMLMFSVVMVLLFLVVAIGAVCVGFLLGGVIYVCTSIPILFQHIATGFFLFGLGIAMAGIGALAGVGTVYFARFSWRCAKELFGRMLPRMISAIIPKRRAAQ